jgi:hypothetical protein
MYFGNSIVSYMTKQSMPAVSNVNEDNLEEFKALDKITIIGYVASDDKASNKSFTTFAESQRDNYLFAASNDASLAKAEGVKQTSMRRRLCTMANSRMRPFWNGSRPPALPLLASSAPRLTPSTWRYVHTLLCSY